MGSISAYSTANFLLNRARIARTFYENH
jgi:hypothetical protein